MRAAALLNAWALAWRSVLAAPVRSGVVVLGLAVAAFLPLFTYLVASRLERTLVRRAESTPIIVGAKGNEFDLTMSSLYFRGQVGEPIRYAERAAIEQRGYRGPAAVVVPLLVRYRAGAAPLVGTTREYFEQRRLRPAAGRLPAVLGEAVAGAELARRTGAAVGDTIRSDLTNLYNLAGAYPVLLRIVGVLAKSGGADDEVYFTDVKTTWAIEGRLHGHEPVTRERALNADAVEGENLEASAALFLFSEIDPSNLESFHLHGDPGDGPLSALLVFPPDQRTHDQLLGDYALSETRQAVRPAAVVRTVLGIVLRVRDGLTAYYGAVVASTLLFVVLVVMLSLRLRERELLLLRRIGASRGTIALLFSAEIAALLLAAAAVAAFAAGIGLFLVASRLPG